jgi:hypothetical protein
MNASNLVPASFILTSTRAVLVGAALLAGAADLAWFALGPRCQPATPVLSVETNPKAQDVFPRGAWTEPRATAAHLQGPPMATQFWIHYIKVRIPTCCCRRGPMNMARATAGIRLSRYTSRL